MGNALQCVAMGRVMVQNHVIRALVIVEHVDPIVEMVFVKIVLVKIVIVALEIVGHVLHQIQYVEIIHVMVQKRARIAL